MAQTPPALGQSAQTTSKGSITLSNAQPTEHYIQVNNIKLCYFEWFAELKDQGPTYLLAHATGFHARVWDQLISNLGPCHIISIDQRGHGRSENRLINNWHDMGQDIAGLCEALQLTQIIGAGHSMGGHAMAEAAAICPNRFSRLVLIDPVIAAPEAYSENAAPTSAMDVKQNPIAKRKNSFASPQAMRERFKDRKPYSIFHPNALTAYCQYGVIEQPNGEFHLACPPEIEASVYMTSRSNSNIHNAVKKIDMPVLILRAQLPKHPGVLDFSMSPTWPNLVHEFRQGTEIHFTQNTHFLVMELPKIIASLILNPTADTTLETTKYQKSRQVPVTQ